MALPLIQTLRNKKLVKIVLEKSFIDGAEKVEYL